ncbi:MAG TPA: type II secretion system protein GspL [Gammaproteobacteria bacterium]
MVEKLIIWIGGDAASTSADARWLVLDANGNRVGFPQQGALENIAPLAANRRVTVMLPGERIIAATARVPGKNPKRILQAAPYALEERLAGDVDALHVALLARGDDQHCDFLVVQRDWLAEWLAVFHDAGLRIDQLWPDYLGVPAEPEIAHWLILDGRLLSREGWSGFAAPVEDAGFLYTHRESDAPLRLSIVGDQPPPAALAEQETARIADTDRAFTELAAGIASLPGHGLLQGAFRPRRDEQANWQRWRWPAVAAVTCLALGLAALGLDAWRLQRESAFLERATQNLFEQALPGGRQIPGQERYLIEQALGGASTTDSRALQTIANVAHALQGVENARLNGFNFRNDTFEMSVTVPNATTLESLRDALAERAGQPVEVQSANSTDDGLEGRLLIADGGAQ